MNRSVSQCPVCDGPLQVTELTCEHCATRLQGHFPPPALARLSQEHQSFIETFVRCRGVIRDVERALGISYPTVRTRLDAAVDALEALFAEPDAATEERRREILRQVEGGTLSASEAARLLRHL